MPHHSKPYNERDPFPHPRYQNDDDFLGAIKPRPSKRPWKATTAPPGVFNEQPWNRLAKTHTLASKRHEYHYFDPQAPLDQFDFAIKAVYDQHCDAFRDCNEVVFQRETTTTDHGRQLKNRVKEVPPPYDPMFPPLRIEGTRRKMHPSKNPGVIQGHHAPATNRGYSRKHNGTFYVI